MRWNWELKDWPHFKFDTSLIVQQERSFLVNVGSASAYLKNISNQEYTQFAVEILTSEGLKSSKIEGEILDQESLQSSIRRHFGLKIEKKEHLKETGMANVLVNVYKFYDQPLTHETLWGWHKELMQGQDHIEDLGRYRTHPEPMQIVSRRYNVQKVFFEAPPSVSVFEEMEKFLKWFHSKMPSESLLARAAIAHIYFESIHPFEDGNGRIGRLIVEKVLSQGVGKPVLIAISKVLEKQKKEYYAALERCNHTLEFNEWITFFANTILQAQQESMTLLYYLVEKSKLMTRLAGELNARQEKVILRMFEEGPTGFKGGLSAENYISITKTSRATATRDLADLVQKDVLRKTGELRHTRYWLNLNLKI